MGGPLIRRGTLEGGRERERERGRGGGDGGRGRERERVGNPHTTLQKLTELETLIMK